MKKWNKENFYGSETTLCVCVSVCVCVCMHAQSRLNPCDPCGLSPTGSLIHEFFQARMLEQIGISYTRGSS